MSPTPISPSRKTRTISIAVDVALVLLVVAAPIVATLVVPPSGPASSAANLPPPDYDLILNACLPIESDEFLQECILANLYPMLETHGVQASFDALQELANRNDRVFKRDHPLAHSLGREAFLRLGDAPSILAQCPYTMASGCFHGVQEAFLSTRTGELSGDDVRNICAKTNAVRGTYGYFQCLHGLGHGINMFYDHDLWTAITACDHFPDTWSRESCYGGVFMENIVSFQVWSGLGVGEGVLHNHDDEEGEVHHGWLYADDPHYPCNKAEEKHMSACYGLQTTAFLTLNGYNVEAAFEICDDTDPDWIWACYNSMGRDISSISNRVPSAMLAACYDGNDSYDEWCVYGGVRDLVNTAGKTDPGWPMCKMAQERYKARCYQGIGEMMVAMYSDKLARWDECMKAESDYRDDCRWGAGV